MKTIKEKILYIKFAKSLGMPIDPSLQEEVERYQQLQKEAIESVRASSESDLNLQVKQNEHVPSAPVIEQVVPKQKKVKTLVEKAAHEISKQVQEAESFQQPPAPTIEPNIDAVVKKLKFLEQFISKIAVSGPGSGEVNLRYLDDVDRLSIADGLFLRYNATSKKFEFDENDHLTSFSSNTQTIANVMISQTVELGNADVANNISLGANSTIVFSKTNTYNITPSLQLQNLSNDPHDFYLWLRKNFVNVPNTNNVFTVPAKKSSNIPGRLIATTPIPIQVVSGDVVQIMCNSDSTDISIEQIPTMGLVPLMPAAPSVILVVNRI
jgi:hypothetical protein